MNGDLVQITFETINKINFSFRLKRLLFVCNKQYLNTFLKDNNH